MKKIILKSSGKKEKSEKGGKLFYGILFLTIITVGTTGYIMRIQKSVTPNLSDNNSYSKTAAERSVFVPDGSGEKASADTVGEVTENSAEATYVAEQHWQSDDVLPVTQDISLQKEPLAQQESVKETGDALPDNAEDIRLVYPVDGEIIKGHSDTELSYSKTMEDWRLHRGVDIKAKIGTAVTAASDGVISDCYNDIAYGVTIIIDHGNGLHTVYSNMASSEMVSTGDKVSSGDVIGVVGDTAEFEIADEAHLHFEVIKDGRSVEPGLYMSR